MYSTPVPPPHMGAGVDPTAELPPRSDSEQSEIFSPIPRKHTSITAKDSLHWLRTETPSPAPSNQSFVSNYSVTNAARYHTHHPPTSPSMHPHNHLPYITRRSRKPSSIGSLAERARGGASSRMGFSSVLTRHAVNHHAKENGEWEGDFARRWIRWMHKEGIKRWILPCVLLTTTWIKWTIGLGSYSGTTSNRFPGARISNFSSLGWNTPPMFGDYEAQRHWMEITIHLRFQQWYKYNLQYWGLDYPPLTAYVSWLCGKVYLVVSPHRRTAS